MKLKKVTKVKDNIYEIVYVSGLFKTYKSAKVYEYGFDWRFSETGKKLPYSLATSLIVITGELKIGDSFYTESHEITNPPLLIKSVDDMLFLIDSIRETDRYITDIYLNGSCYQFHLMLKKFAPDCEARITKEKNHIVTYFKGKHFDITGIVEGQFEPLNNNEIEMASKWSFAKSKVLQICECPFCEEPIVV